ncbi:MAG: helix-turn-helix domain-containing protein [Limnochordia bacterium]|nr:helix-turn-helix domain-containing protein [Limnochordia bacterium]
MEQLMKPKEVAEILGVSMTVLREMIWSGQIGYINVNKGGQYIYARFTRQHIEDFLNKSEVRAG